MTLFTPSALLNIYPILHQSASWNKSTINKLSIVKLPGTVGRVFQRIHCGTQRNCLEENMFITLYLWSRNSLLSLNSKCTIVYLTSQWHIASYHCNNGSLWPQLMHIRHTVKVFYLPYSLENYNDTEQSYNSHILWMNFERYCME